MDDPSRVELAYNPRSPVTNEYRAHWRPLGTNYGLCGAYVLAGTRNSIERKRAAAMPICPNCAAAKEAVG